MHSIPVPTAAAAVRTTCAALLGFGLVMPLSASAGDVAVKKAREALGAALQALVDHARGSGDEALIELADEVRNRCEAVAHARGMSGLLE